MLTRLRRIAAMPPQERRARLKEKWRLWGPRGLALRASWHVDRITRAKFNVPYVGRADVGPRNLEVKEARAAAGGSFEQPAIQLINLAAVGLLAEGSRVLEVGGGTGYFAVNAARLRGATVTCSELDARTRAWAERNRPDPRVTYCDLTLEAVAPGTFDVVVALELVEHIAAFGPFLRALSSAASTAIVSTPNKSRDPFSAIRTVPDYDEHVLEWTAGEFYWVLRAFWSDVEVWTIPRYAAQTSGLASGRLSMPVLRRAGMWESEAPLIAVCRSAMAGLG
jgi:2-polyprenyl-3-methyl-5-hydroxy-6-metoxy-1,4-benzoquinol methylase